MEVKNVNFPTEEGGLRKWLLICVHHGFPNTLPLN